MKPAVAFIAIAVLSLVLVACGEKKHVDANDALSGSTVTITDIRPSVASPLSVGQDVRLQVSVAYALTSDSGTLALVVQDGKDTVLGEAVSAVVKGSGTEKLEVSFKVPDTNIIQVFTPLAGQGQTATSMVATRSFRVQSK